MRYGQKVSGSIHGLGCVLEKLSAAWSMHSWSWSSAGREDDRGCFCGGRYSSSCVLVSLERCCGPLLEAAGSQGAGGLIE